jgi:hypothetical protein
VAVRRRKDGAGRVRCVAVCAVRVRPTSAGLAGWVCTFEAGRVRARAGEGGGWARGTKADLLRVLYVHFARAAAPWCSL